MNEQVHQESQQNVEIENLMAELDSLKKQNSLLVASSQRVQQVATIHYLFYMGRLTIHFTT